MSTISEISETGQIVYDNSTSKKINNLLNSPTTRSEGLELLLSYLPQCPDDDFIKYCVSWMQSCCKVDGFIKNRDFGIKLLGILFQVSSNYQELKKSVSFFITSRYFDYVLKYLINSEFGWECTEICMSLYKGACGPFQGTIEKHLKNELTKNVKISPIIARCAALLPSLGGVGNENLNYQRNWKIQFKKFINVCHLILDNLFLNVEESQKYESEEDSYWTAEENKNNPEYCITHLYNCCNVLNHMLLSRYPVPKAISTDLIFQLVGRGLVINIKSLRKRATTDIIALQKMLPEIHNTLLSLLKALIVTCKNQLLPYAYLICKLLRQTLEGIEPEISYSNERPFGQVRVSVYETLCNWLVVSKCGGCVESISSIVIATAAADISRKKDIVVLKESKQKIQSLTRERGSCQVIVKTNEKLCFVALKSLQFLLKFVGFLLKPEEHKFLQEFTIKLLIDVQKTATSDMLVPFSASKCRKELYSLLLKLVQHPCPQWPPPTHFALRLFRKGVADECVQVSLICSSALNVTVNLIHPQYSNEKFLPGEAHETQRQWTGQPMEVDDQIDRPENENLEETRKSDFTEKISNLDKAHNSSQKNTTKAVIKGKDADENAILNKSLKETNEEDPSPKKSRMSREIEDKIAENNQNSEREKITPEKDQIPEKKKVMHEEDQTSEKVTPEKDQPPEKEEVTPEKDQTCEKEEVTPEKDETCEKEKVTSEKDKQTAFDKESEKTEDSESVRSLTPEVNEEKKPKKTYFLRSKTKGSSEESEEGKSPDNLKNTPLRGLIKVTPKRPRTRSLLKVECESETESKMTKKSEDDEENIIAVFDDSIVE